MFLAAKIFREKADDRLPEMGFFWEQNGRKFRRRERSLCHNNRSQSSLCPRHSASVINGLPARVARWFIFKPESRFWVNFGWSWNVKCFGMLFYRPLVCFTAIWYLHFIVIWYILGSFGIFFPVLISCTKKNLATLLPAVINALYDCQIVCCRCNCNV
jgi:hypothetical protein